MTKQEFAKQIVNKCIIELKNKLYVAHAYTEAETLTSKYQSYYPPRLINLDTLTLKKHESNFAEVNDNQTYYYVYAYVENKTQRVTSTLPSVLARSTDEELIDMVLKHAKTKIINFYI